MKRACLHEVVTPSLTDVYSCMIENNYEDYMLVKLLINTTS